MTAYKNYDEVMAYTNGIIKGEIIANKYRIKACKRFKKDLENPEYTFDPKDAEFVINIIEKTICHQQGEQQDSTPLRGTPVLFDEFSQVYHLQPVGIQT